MNLTQAAQSENVGKAAVLYAMDEISVIPLVGKKAAGGWQEYQRRAATPNRVARWQHQGLLQNVGIVCGAVSRLAVIDLDGLPAVALFEERFPGLLHTFTVATGSGTGQHIYLSPATMPPTTRVMGLPTGGNIELRANGCYVVAPPSLHPDTGRPYTVARLESVMRVRDLDFLVRWLKSLKPEKQPPTPARPAAGQVSGGRTIVFAQAALTRECAILRQTPQGNQNNRLNIAAYNLGQLVGDGLLTRSEVEAALLSVAVGIGQDERQSGRTIASGLEAGIRNPRSEQWRKR